MNTERVESTTEHQVVRPFAHGRATGLVRWLANILPPWRRYWRTSLATFLVLAVGGGGAVCESGFLYRATASVLLSPPTYQSKGPSNEFMPPLLDIPSYARLMVDDAVLQSVCERVNREKPELWASAKVHGRLVPEAIRKQVWVGTEVVEKTPQSVRYSSAISLTGEMKSPDQVKHMMDVWCDECVAKAREVTKPGLELTIEFIRGEYEKARQELGTRETALSEFRARNDLTMMRKLLDAYESQVAEYSLNLSQLPIKIAENSTSLAEIQAQLAKEDRKMPLRRSPSDDALAVIYSVGREERRNAAYTSFVDEALNSVFTGLREKEASLLAMVKGLETQLAKVASESERLHSEANALNGRLSKLLTEQERLQRDVATGKAYYEQLARQREDMAALEATLRLDRGSCIVIANAPIRPSRASNTMKVWGGLFVSTLLALLASLALANVLDGYQEIVHATSG